MELFYVAIRIKNLQNLKVFKHSIYLVAGKNGINKNVQSITVMEVEDFTEFHLGEGLFVLTTFSTSADDPKKMEKIFLNLIQKNISGIGIKINRFLKKIPLSLIRLANKFSTPLFLIEKEVPFRTVITDVTSLIINQQFETIKSLNDQYEDLYTSILKGEDLGFYLQQIGRSLSCNCFCFSHTDELLEQYIQTTPENTELLFQFIHSLMNEPEKVWEIIGSGEKYLANPTGEFFVFPCIAYNKILGYFAVQHLNHFNSEAMMNVKQITSFLSIKLMEDAIKKESETKFKIQLANDLFFNTNLNEDTIRGKLNVLGLSPEEYYYLVYIEPSNQTQNHYNIINSSYLKDKISLFLETHNFNYLISDISDGYYILLTFEHHSRFNDTTILKESLNKLAKIIEIPFGFKIGCSQKESRLVDISNALKSAQNSILIGKELYPEESIYYYEDYFEIRIIMGLLNTKEHDLIRSRIIEPLEKYDKKYKSHLLDTLETCLKTPSLQEASKSLFIHSSTLRYRLEKIHELTGANFFTNLGRYSLTNAFLLSKLEKIFGLEIK